MTDKLIRLTIAALLGTSYFLMHTALTYILQPEWIGSVFLIFAFGFIFQGLEYFFVIPSSNDKPPRISVIGFILGAQLLPLMFFGAARHMNVFGMKNELGSTEICIMAIMTYQVFRDIIIAVRDTNDKDK